MASIVAASSRDPARERGAQATKPMRPSAVVALFKAFALAAANDAARTVREEVDFVQAIRAALVKNVPGNGKKSAAERELAIQQIVSRAVVSIEIADIMKAAGLESPDISILSDEFLAEVPRDQEKEPTSFIVQWPRELGDVLRRESEYPSAAARPGAACLPSP